MSVERIRVIVIDDHAVVREGLRQVLAQDPEIEVVGLASDAFEALEMVRDRRPSVVILDLAMPKISGMDAIHLIKEAAPDCQVVVLSMHGKESMVHHMLDAGALGYVLKASPVSDVLAAVKASHRGEYYLSSRIRAEVVSAYLKSRQERPQTRGYDLLTEREQQIFRLVAEGNSTNRIAALLSISPKTVEKHRGNIMRKMGLGNTMELVKEAIKVGVIDPDLWDS